MKKLVMALLILAMLSIVLTPMVGADDVEVFMNTDKTQYAPGEKGKIFITIRNTSEDPIEVKNASVVFADWMLYTADGWDELGNQTIVYEEIIVGSNTTVALDDVTFTVPSDGRADSTWANIMIYTNDPTLQTNKYIRVVDPSTQSLLRAMDNIVMLLTVAAILAIISAIIVAAAIFLSGRRPGPVGT